MTAVLAVVLGVLVLGLAVVHHVLLVRPLPQVRGTVVVDAIRAPVRITRDRFGVPHIEADSIEDAAFALGFVHAQDRGWQLELSRRVAWGRLSEVAGAATLEADRFVRRLGLARVAEAEERLLEGEPRRVLDAYSAGVNAVLCHRPRPLELLLVRLRPELWRPAHSLAYLRLVSLGLAADWETTLLRCRLLQAVGPEVAAALEPVYPDGAPTICAATVTPATVAAAAERGERRSGEEHGPAAVPAPTAVTVPALVSDKVGAMYRAAARWLPLRASGAGSNSWVVAGRHTASGRPLLANDPHLPPTVPSVWYEAHVRAGDDVEVAGVTFPGLPFVIIGHNRRVAWGFTNAYADVQDLVIEELDDAGRRHRTADGWRDCLVHRERIAVRGRTDGVEEEVVETAHGPLLQTFTVDGVRRGLALQWSLLRPGRTVEGLLALQRAGDWNAFRSALDLVDAAPQNAVYADVDGHIGYTLTGRIPVRRGAPSRLPVPGWTGDAEVVRFLGVEEKPQLFDPPDGLIVTANNRIVGDAFPHHVAFEAANGFRALRLEQLLRGRSGVDPAFLVAVQLDVVSPAAREVTELLRGVRCRGLAEEARRGLCAWDGAMRPEAAEPCVYAAFLRHLAEVVLRPWCGDAWRLAAGEMEHPVFGFAGTPVGRLTPWLLQRWRQGDVAVLGGRQSWEDAAAEALTDAVAELRRTLGPPRRWRWGRLHAMPLVHALGRRRLLGWLLNCGRVEVGGDTDTVHQTAFIPAEPYATRAWAPSWRQILDVGNWDACTGVHLPGQSGHPGSRHHHDLVARWRQNRQHPLAWSRDAVGALAEAQLLLVPRPRAVERREDDWGRQAA